MLTFFERKIEEIRREPESVRIRYVIGMVAVMMAGVLVIWFFGLREGLRNSNPAEGAAIVRETFSGNDPDVSPVAPTGPDAEREELSLEEVFGSEGE